MELEGNLGEGVGSTPPADLQPVQIRLDIQEPEVGPPSPEHEALATPSITPPDDADEDELLTAWRGDALFAWFGDLRG
jgi:hypothetical protein